MLLKYPLKEEKLNNQSNTHPLLGSSEILNGTYANNLGETWKYHGNKRDIIANGTFIMLKLVIKKDFRIDG